MDSEDLQFREIAFAILFLAPGGKDIMVLSDKRIMRSRPRGLVS